MDENLFRQIKSKLKTEYFLANDDWLQDCIDYYVNELGNPSEKEIFEFVRSQWLLSDLREINNHSGSLPRNISLQKSTTLTGNFILQVEQIYNIAVSKYKQLEQIRSKNVSVLDDENDNEYDDQKTKISDTINKRMMQLKLTDGLQDLIGIEYKYIPRLDDMFLPGYKIMIIGPVRCRKGVLLLEQGKIKGIGGEVDSLLIPNALENILARALNQEENSDPYYNDHPRHKKNDKVEEIVEDNFFENDFEIDLEEVSRIEGWSCKKQEPENPSASLQEKNKTQHVNVEKVAKNQKINATCQKEIKTTKLNLKEENQNSNIEPILEKDNSLLEMVDESGFIEKTSMKKGLRAFPIEDNLSGDVIVVSDDEAEERNLKVRKSQQNILYSNHKAGETNFKAKRTQQNIPKKDLNFFFTRMSDKRIVSENPGASVSENGGKRLSVPISPRETTAAKKLRIENNKESIKINKLTELIHQRRPQMSRQIIRAKVEVLGKLSKDKMNWTLEATVYDNSGNIEISFSNHVLESFLNLTVEEFLRKKKLKKSNPDIEPELRVGFRNAEQKLKNLDALFELEILHNEKPKVINIINCTE